MFRLAHIFASVRLLDFAPRWLRTVLFRSSFGIGPPRRFAPLQFEALTTTGNGRLSLLHRKCLLPSSPSGSQSEVYELVSGS